MTFNTYFCVYVFYHNRDFLRVGLEPRPTSDLMNKLFDFIRVTMTVGPGSSKGRGGP